MNENIATGKTDLLLDTDVMTDEEVLEEVRQLVNGCPEPKVEKRGNRYIVRDWEPYYGIILTVKKDLPE